jgi:hypothetical protein
MAIEIRIASPCDEKWESMRGDDRSRFCARCSLHVFNLQSLSEQEVRALFLKTEGRVCGQIFRRRDGTVLTSDCPRGLALVRRKALAGLALVATMLVALVSFRLSGERACPPKGEETPGWFSTVFGQRYVDARETLRRTKSFGPLIDELSPRATRGRMVMIRP